jgi:hypothetical protein
MQILVKALFIDNDGHIEEGTLHFTPSIIESNEEGYTGICHQKIDFSVTPEAGSSFNPFFSDDDND